MPLPRTPTKYDNEDSSTDEGKRKRSKDEEEGSEDSSISRKETSSPDKKKIHRSPGKMEQKENAKIDQILGILQNLSIEVNQIRTDQREYNKELKKLKEENEMIRKENNSIKKEFKEMKEQLDETNERLERLERERRRNNVVVSGLELDNDPSSLKEDIGNFIQQELGVGVNIKTAFKIGPKLCLIQLETFEDKIKILQNKMKLRNMGEEKVFINNDLTRKERDIDKQIRKRAEEERKLGKTVKIGYQKITIEGREWRWNRRKNAVEEVASNGNPVGNPKN
uniref:Uncharacterized protein n=1 Tax=Photinus pyralis TaxID=7054 RepID=A0A1Y1M2F4_PHOPY